MESVVTYTIFLKFTYGTYQGFEQDKHKAIFKFIFEISICGAA